MAFKMESLRNAKFAKTKLGKFIVNFAEFTSKMQDVDYDPLFDALDALSLNLESQLASAQQSDADAEVIHNNLIINYENARDNANSDVISTTQTLQTLADDVVTYQEEIATAQNDIAADNEAIVNLNSARNEQVAQYEKDVEDTNSGIDSIDEALTLLRSLQTSSDTGSFIQLNEKAFTDVKSKLQKAFDQVSSKKRTHYKYRPLLMAVVEIMNKQNFVNQEALGRVINLLVDLRAGFADYLVKLDSDEAVAEENYNAQLNGLNTAIALSTEDLNTASTNLENTNASILGQQAFLATRTEDYDNAVASIALENDLRNRAVQAYNDLVDEINAELKVVAESVGALNAGGIARSA